MDWCLWVYRHAYCCKRYVVKKFCPTDECYQKIRVHTDSLPWFWIGIKYNDNESVSVTEFVNNSIEYGMVVTPTYLSELTGFNGGKWLYMDSKTLEEKEFPSEGFVIEDVLDMAVSNS